MTAPELPQAAPGRCEEYERHLPQWRAAVKEEERLRGATVELLRTMGRRAVIDTRVEARRAVGEIEAEINAHIGGCTLCRAARRPKLNTAKLLPY